MRHRRAYPPLMSNALRLSALIAQHAAEPEARHAPLMKTQFNQPALPVKHLDGKLPAVFTFSLHVSGVPSLPIWWATECWQQEVDLLKVERPPPFTQFRAPGLKDGGPHTGLGPRVAQKRDRSRLGLTQCRRTSEHRANRQLGSLNAAAPQSPTWSPGNPPSRDT